MSHGCPIRPCNTTSIGDHHFMCRLHRNLLPKKLLKRVNQAWNNGQGRDTPEFRSAQRAAIQSVHERLKNQLAQNHADNLGTTPARSTPNPLRE